MIPDAYCLVPLNCVVFSKYYVIELKIIGNKLNFTDSQNIRSWRGSARIIESDSEVNDLYDLQPCHY